MTTQYLCKTEGRRTAVRVARDEAGNPVVNGIDFLEVSADQRVLDVHFIHPLPGQPGAVPPAPAAPLTAGNLVVEGGVRIRNVNIESVESGGSVLKVKVSTQGDFSIYTLHLVESHTDDRTPDGFDPALSRIDFSFKVACPVDFDCAAGAATPPEAPIEPATNYLAKDYQTFRQLMLDRLSVVMPDWRERTPADLQVALVELMAYVGDGLSYYQDAVASEAYLGTARKRISVRRHARLLDYAIHEGSNARAWVCLTVVPNSQADGATLLAGTTLVTRAADSQATFDPIDNARAFESDAPTVFETMQDVMVYADRNLFRFHTWSSQECWLPTGATRATLIDPSGGSASSPPLGRGDVLVFEETLSPVSGLGRDADPARRCVVRLKGAPPAVDPLTGTPVIDIEWEDEDALPFGLCLSARLADPDGGQRLIEPSVARGNMVLADHGATIRDEPLIPPIVPATGNYRPTIAAGQLTFQASLGSASATSALRQDVHTARPIISLDGDGGPWTSQPDLLASDAFSRHFVVEMQSDGSAHVRFGDGVSGRRPAPGAAFTATYRNGTGTHGNVGPDAIAGIVSAPGGISAVRNPLGAIGGTDPEALEQIRQFAPRAFRTQQRAVTAADYAEIAERRPETQKAAATFRWTGSWFTASVTVDRKAGQLVDAPLKTTLAEYLEPFRMAGYDLEVSTPILVPLEVALAVCVKPGYFQAEVKQTLLQIFGSRDLPDGTRGFFHPDNFTFGQSLYLSQMYRTAMQVSGVASVNVTRFKRWTQDANHELEKGVIAAAPREILQLANDPNFPESGRLAISVAGGL